jgi:hypothetical protein
VQSQHGNQQSLTRGPRIWTRLSASITVASLLFLSIEALSGLNAEMHLKSVELYSYYEVCNAIWRSATIGIIGIILQSTAILILMIWIASVWSTIELLQVDLQYDNSIEKAKSHDLRYDGYLAGAFKVQQMYLIFTSENLRMPDAHSWTPFRKFLRKILDKATARAWVLFNFLAIALNLMGNRVHAKGLVLPIIMLLWLPANALTAYMTITIMKRVRVAADYNTPTELIEIDASEKKASRDTITSR